MTTISKESHSFVWIWLPNAISPIVAGKLEEDEHQQYDFFYGKAYLHNPKSISFDKQELPLKENVRFSALKQLHFAFRDSLPDAWGQRILLYQYPNSPLTFLNMLLLSSSDRIGALHFQNSEHTYVPQYENNATLEELMEAASYIEQGKTIPKHLALALFHGTSIGGARPKALIESNDKKYIAKFSSSSDLFPIVQAEFAAMSLAKRIGINASSVKLKKTAGKYVLLVERFDRTQLTTGWSRRWITSALSLLRLEETECRYASYLDLCDQIRKFCQEPRKDLEELFRRLVFNILVGNTDDHAKNHAFFWDGTYYQLTPAYDICPYLRSGQQATQAMTVGKMGSFSLLKNALSAANHFQLTTSEANKIIEEMTAAVKTNWPLVCEEAELTSEQCNLLTGKAVLNPYCFYDTP